MGTHSLANLNLVFGLEPVITVPFWLVGNSTFPERLKRLRLARGLTQKQLSEAAGVSKDLVYRWEREYHGPAARTARRVAAVLGVRARDLVDDTSCFRSLRCRRRPRSNGTRAVQGGGVG